jgi:thioredoxin 1
MKIINILLTLVMLFAFAIAGEIEIPDEGLVVVNFYAEWCDECVPSMELLDSLGVEYSDVEIIHVNVDDHYDLAVELGIKTLPFIVFVEDGEILGAIDGDVTFDLDEAIILEQLDIFRGE